VISITDPAKFARRGCVVEGWYWVMRASRLKRGKVKPVTVMGRDLAMYRGRSGTVVALDAYCPHMGAHLAEGRVENDALRCFFHNWRFDRTGRCTDIPCQARLHSDKIQVRSWPVREKYGLIWVWAGDKAHHDVPEIPELEGAAYDCRLGKAFVKGCHPNVVMVNAIDEQHFHTVHRLPGSILRMEPEAINAHNIRFNNRAAVPASHWLGRIIRHFYQDVLTYSLSYWYGSLGMVTFGPDFLHLHVMFALREGPAETTEGQTILFTRHRRGPFGWLINRLILGLTGLGAGYFAIGDTRVFQTIRFHFKTPIPADRSVIDFIRHFETQPLASEWTGTAQTVDGPTLTLDRKDVRNA
jgi:phenylpropionate dioxygenase-like ring-hydroxylating dioxygenase large terminal subunit